MSLHEFDVLIIGCGISGLSSAIKLAEKGLNVGIYTLEENPEEANTLYAQGGIIYADKNDKSLENDIDVASSGTANPRAIEILHEKSGDILVELLLKKARVPFDRGDDGELQMTMEAAHSESRIIHIEDHTGREIQKCLLNYVLDRKRFPNISFYSKHTAIDLLTPIHMGVRIQQRYEDDRVVGAYLLNQQSGEVVKVMSKVTILATGGFGAIYLHHSNTERARGDGQSMARRAGVSLNNMEFIQFHPTTFFESSTDRRFLISEAVRGEGGILYNSQGDRFMKKYHKDAELAPRDVVARAILEEIIETKNDCVYLDISHKGKEWVKKRFPTIYQKCLDRGVDIAKNAIPVVPAAHYTCGGIKTNLKGQTSLKGLYAVGEVACTGLHGANRLASTSLLEGLTWGYLAASEIIDTIFEVELYNHQDIRDWELKRKNVADIALIRQDWMTLRQTMWNYVGLTRSTTRLNRAQAILHELYDEIQKFYRNNMSSDELIGLRNAVEVAHSVLNASKINNQSVGCFYRSED
ncbi:MAG: L-aspartate oxidase [Bacteriovoracaceae bacterium]|nr:L-aspartate oxidase [Bacteriovoracaceae bacterium]